VRCRSAGTGFFGRVRSRTIDRHLVHPAPVEVGADRPLEVVDEAVHFLVRRSPVEITVLIRCVAVERGSRQSKPLGVSALRCTIEKYSSIWTFL
jgi:hypothetical protein